MQHHKQLPKRMATLLVLTLGLSLGGCFKSNPPIVTERYSLPQVTANSLPQTSPRQPRLLILGQLQLADYLDSDRIVVQTSDITLQPARDHLWVDNLAQELRRGLRARLALRLDNRLIVDAHPGMPAAATLSLSIDQFHGQLSGDAILSGHWQLSGLDNGDRGQFFTFKTPLAENGYPALVRALGQDLDLLSEQIANQLAP